MCHLQIKQNENDLFWQVHDLSTTASRKLNYCLNWTSFEEWLPSGNDHIPLNSLVYHSRMGEGTCLLALSFTSWAHSCQSLLVLRFADQTCKPNIKLVQFKKIMNYLLLPHELNQRHKTEDFENLKISHKLYTLGVVGKYHEQEGMVDSYGRYWFHDMDAQEEFLLVQSLASKGFERTYNG